MAPTARIAHQLWEKLCGRGPKRYRQPPKDDRPHHWWHLRAHPFREEVPLANQVDDRHGDLVRIAKPAPMQGYVHMDLSNHCFGSIMVANATSTTWGQGVHSPHRRTTIRCVRPLYLKHGMVPDLGTGLPHDERGSTWRRGPCPSAIHDSCKEQTQLLGSVVREL